MKKIYSSLIINLGLLSSGLFAIFSGLLIQVQYHIGHHVSDSANKYSLGLNYASWSGLHKFVITFLLVFVVLHIYLHWKWYKAVIAKRLVNKNRQVILLTIIFVLAALTGILPWIIHLAEGNKMLRKAFIEIHDKIAIILAVFFILHIMKRLKWFLITFKKIREE